MYSICPADWARSPRRRNSTALMQGSSNYMATDHSGTNHDGSPHGGVLSHYVFSTDPKVIGLNYLWLALFSLFFCMAMSLVMRIHLVWPGSPLPLSSPLRDSPHRYTSLP